MLCWKQGSYNLDNRCYTGYTKNMEEVMRSPVTSVTLKEDTVKKIEELKVIENRSMSNIINEAVRYYHTFVVNVKQRP